MSTLAPGELLVRLGLPSTLHLGTSAGTISPVIRAPLHLDELDAALDRALVCLGSVKSNPVVELVLAELFHCEPFVSQDEVNDPRERNCPIFMRLRDNDPHPASCSVGRVMHRSRRWSVVRRPARRSPRR